MDMCASQGKQVSKQAQAEGRESVLARLNSFMDFFLEDRRWTWEVQLGWAIFTAFPAQPGSTTITTSTSKSTEGGSYEQWASAHRLTAYVYDALGFNQPTLLCCVDALILIYSIPMPYSSDFLPRKHQNTPEQYTVECVSKHIVPTIK